MRAYVRHGAIVVPFTAPEDALAERLRIAGWSLSEIGAHLGRPTSSVRNRLVALARHAEGDVLQPRRDAMGRFIGGAENGTGLDACPGV